MPVAIKPFRLIQIGGPNIEIDMSSQCDDVVFQCGSCEINVSAKEMIGIFNEKNNRIGLICLCPICRRPTHFEDTSLGLTAQIPPPIPGKENPYLSDTIKVVYREARNCMSVKAYTATAMLIRKLIMLIAIDKGDEWKPKKPFVSYLSYLFENGKLGNESANWVKDLKEQGDKANHLECQITQSTAERLLTAIEVVLSYLYTCSEEYHIENTIDLIDD